MTELVWAVGGTALSMAVMYVTCVRQMRRGHGRAIALSDPAPQEITRLRAEVARLRRTTAAR